MRDADLLRPERGWARPDYVRIPAPPQRQRAVLLRALSGVARLFGRAELPHIFPVIGINGRIFWPWLLFASQMMPFGRLPATDREKAILRVAWRCRSRYEWGQHVDIGLRAGVSVEDIVRVHKGADAPGWEPRLRALIRACDEFHHQRMVTDQTWAELEDHYDTPRLLEVLMLIGQYEGLAGVLNSTGLPLDMDLEKILASAPIHD